MLHDKALQKRVSELNSRFSNESTDYILTEILTNNILGRTALVSSFGAESAVLLHMVSEINPDTPVLFIDTEFLFPETLEYLTRLALTLNLRDIRRIVPDPGRIAVYDQERSLHKTNKDQCCYLRKTLPLHRALGEFSSWITGRKRFQSYERSNLSLFELDTVTSRIKINPLIDFTSEKLRKYMKRYDLPLHPLVKSGYPSIGCEPCTSPVKIGEHQRAGRWRNEEKTECGIHFTDERAIKLTENGVA